MKNLRNNFLLSVLAVTFSCNVASNDSDDVAAAATNLYVYLSGRDRAGFFTYVPESGFTEINADFGPGLHEMKVATFEEILGSPTKIDLKIQNIKTNVYGEVAVVTGSRVGSITEPGQKIISRTRPISMVWQKVESKWKVRHIHLSGDVGQAK